MDPEDLMVLYNGACAHGTPGRNKECLDTWSAPSQGPGQLSDESRAKECETSEQQQTIIERMARQP